MDAYPEDWTVDRLGNIGELYKGSGISRAQADSGDLPAIRYGELYTTHSDYVKEYRSRISAEVANASVLMKKGDIAFAASGETEEEIGKCAVVCDDGVYAGGDLICFRAKAEIDPLFWGFMLNTPVVQRQKTAAAQGATVIHIRRNSIADLIVGYPPIEEQKRIGAALKDIDSLIDNLSKRIEKKKAIKQGAMQELLTGKKRLPGFEGCDDEGVVATQGAECVTTAPTPSGSRGWRKVKLGEYVYCIRGVSYNGDRDLWTEESDNTIRLLRSNNIQDALFVDSGVQFVSKYCATSEQVLRQNDIMICMANGSKDLVGKTCIFKVPFAVPYTFGAFMGCLRAKDSTGCMDYLFQLMNSSAYWKNIELMLSGSSINNLRPTDIERMEFAMPDVAEQRAIAKVLGDMDAEIARLEAKREKLIGIKKGMMSDLLTGKVRLKTEMERRK